MVRSLRCLLALGLLAGIPARAVDPPPRPHFTFAAQDATGLVWACDDDAKDMLFTFDGKEWNVDPAPFINVRTEPVCLFPLKDGAVACVWRVNEKKIIITRHLGAKSEKLATLDASVRTYALPQIPFVDSKNRIWFAEKSYIYRIDPDGRATLVHELTREGVLLKNPNHINPIQFAEDSRGRIWIWTRGDASNYYSLPGVLIFDNGKVETKEIAGLKKGAAFRAMGPGNDRFLYAGVRDVGLCEIDLSTFTAKPVSFLSSDDKRCRCVDRIFAVDGDLYVVATPHLMPSLWRQRNGQWEEIIPRLDLNSDTGRVVYKTDEGFILSGQFFSWFVPRQGPPMKLDWQTGLPVENIKSIFRLSNGSFFVLGRTLFLGPLSLAPAKTDGQVTELRLQTEWTLDAQGKVWLILADEKPMLQYYDGKTWVSYPVPLPPKVTRIAGISPDTRGRIWLLPAYNPPVGLCLDSKTGKWRTFPTMEAAWESVKDDPPKFIGKPWQDYFPVFNKGLIAFRGGGSQLFYFDGIAWQKWKAADITGGKSGTIGIPFFAKGNLCVNSGGSTWKRGKSGLWEKTTTQNPYPDDPWGGVTQAVSDGNVVVATAVAPAPSSQPQLPKEGFPPFTSRWAIRSDNNGAIWFLWDSRLYRYADGVCLEMVDDKNPSPFISLNHIASLFVDKNDIAYLETGSSGSRWFMVRPPFVFPQTFATVKVSEDSATVDIGSNPPSFPEYRWTLNDSPWQLASNNPLRLDYLSNGKYTLKVMARNEKRYADALPATVKFEIKFDPAPRIAKAIEQLSDGDPAKREAALAVLSHYSHVTLSKSQIAKLVRQLAADDGQKRQIALLALSKFSKIPISDLQVANLIAQLRDPDYAKRETAILALARYPAVALPALKKARKSADPDYTWWIDAALQEIEQNQKRSKATDFHR